MALSCKILGHDWDVREKNPHREEDYGAARLCERCNAIEWNYREPS